MDETPRKLPALSHIRISGYNVSFSAEDEIQLVCGSASVVLDGKTHLNGDLIKYN